ncbi:MAG: hypothetical protein KGL50_06070 [Burkholderiales bacterium]|nr:hypothetical protein [Burkholderiales bacterium]
MSPAQNDEAPAAATAQGFQIQTSANADIVADASFCGKRFSALQAELALKGHELRRLPDGTLWVSRWNLSRRLAGLDEAEAFARQVGARP